MDAGKIVLVCLCGATGAYPCMVSGGINTRYAEAREAPLYSSFFRKGKMSEREKGKWRGWRKHPIYVYIQFSYSQFSGEMGRVCIFVWGGVIGEMGSLTMTTYHF